MVGKVGEGGGEGGEEERKCLALRNKEGMMKRKRVG